jgi:hypothetical protein
MPVTTRKSRMLGTSDGTLSAVAPVFAPKLVRTSQPQGSVEIDWGNPVTRGLVAVPNFATNIDSKTKNSVIPSAAVSRSAGKAGVAAKFTGQVSGAYSYGGSGKDLLSGSTALTVSAVFSVPTLTNGVQLSAVWGSSAQANSQYLFGVSSNGSIAFGVCFNDSNALVKATPAGVIQAGKTYSVAASWKFGVLSISVNGVEVALSSNIWVTGSVTSLPNPASGILQFGCKADDLSSDSVIIYHATVGNSYLSPSQLKSLSDNPWQIFRSDTRKLWVAA